MNTLRIIISVLASTVFTAAFAQTAVPPPPKPAADGPTLEVTMKFIQDKLQERGRLNYAIYLHDNADGKDSTHQFSGEPSKIVADPATCRISYHLYNKIDSEAPTEADVSFSLRDVQDLVVMTAEQAWKQRFAADGHPAWDAKIDPPVFLVEARRAGNQNNGFYFPSEEMANRVAKALVHAVELCGGGQKTPEPF
jgi:hypothetical protein